MKERGCRMAKVRKYSEGTMAVSIPEAARMLGVSERILWNRVKDGTVPVFKLGRLVRVTRKTLGKIMEGDNGEDRVSGQGHSM